MTTPYAAPLTVERWNLIPFPKQLLHVGSELSRARSARRKGDVEQERRAYERALELLDLTLAGTRNLSRLRECARLREVIAGFMVEKELSVPLEQVYQSLLHFSRFGNPS